MSNMARTKYPKFVYSKGSFRGPGQYRPSPAIRPNPYGYPGYKPNPYLKPGPSRPRPGSLAEAQANAGSLPFPASYGKVAFRLALNLAINGLLNSGLDPWVNVPKPGSPGFYNLAINGWTLGCSGVPSLSFPFHKVVTHTISTAWLCAPIEEANFGGTLQPGGYGVATIPAGLRTVAFPWGNSASQIKGQNDERWNYPGGGTSPTPVVYVPGRRAVPLEDPFPETAQMEPEPKAATGGQGFGLRGYQSTSMDVTIPERGRPIKNPNGVHDHTPPNRNESEEKRVDKTGRSVSDIYGLLTEGGDLMDCMQRSFKKNPDPAHHKHVPIPQRYDLRVRRMVSEAMAGNIDWDAFLQCMAVESAKDNAIGAANRAGSSRLQKSPYSPRRTSPVGWGVGGFSTRMR